MLVEGDPAEGYGSDDRMMSLEDLEIRLFWKAFVNIVGLEHLQEFPISLPHPYFFEKKEKNHLQ